MWRRWSSERTVAYGPLSPFHTEPRPVLDIVLHGRRGRLPVRALVDSGADHAVLPLVWASDLGISLADSTEMDFETAGGRTALLQAADGVVADVPVAGRRIRLSASFAANLPVAVLGRRDFFAAFRVAFDERAQTFTLALY